MVVEPSGLTIVSGVLQVRNPEAGLVFTRVQEGLRVTVCLPAAPDSPSADHGSDHPDGRDNVEDGREVPVPKFVATFMVQFKAQ